LSKADKLKKAKKYIFPMRYYIYKNINVLSEKIERKAGQKLPKLRAGLFYYRYIVLYKSILSVLKKDFRKIIKRYAKKDDYDTALIGDKIWTCWWHGENNAPPLIKRCLESIRKNAGGREVIVIDRDNISQYIDMPGHIMEKHEAGLMTTTHFSDILRFSLLAEHGGLWLDATMFCFRPIPDSIWKMPLYSLRYFEKHTTPTAREQAETIPTATVGDSGSNGGRENEIGYLLYWVTFAIGGQKGHPLFCFSRDMLVAYWEKYSTLIHYLLVCYPMRLAYRTVDKVKRDADAIPSYTTDSLELRWIFDAGRAYDQNEIDALANSDALFFKLSFKDKFEEYTPNGEETAYKRFIDGTMTYTLNTETTL